MELPEKDRQALIEAARRRGQGGAAFGVYPSSGKRPEKLNVSRDVNMPAQVARGWAAGLLGLPGDIESLGRLGLGLAGADVSETPVLPTSDFYREYLPGYDPAPAARAASGLGALAGGAGSTKLAGAAVKGAKATGRALGPTAAGMAESYLQRSGLAPTVVKPKGGNWLSGSVEGSTGPLKGGMVAGQTPAERIPLHEALLQDPTLPPESVETVRRQLDRTRGEDAINNWIDTKLNKYIRNEMGTPEDPVRKLAERGVTHMQNPPAPETRGWVEVYRQEAGYPREGLGQTPLAKSWENIADEAIAAQSAGRLRGALSEFEGAKTTSDIHAGIDRTLVKERAKQLEDTFKDTPSKDLADEFNLDYEVTDANRAQAIEDWARMEVEGYYRGNAEDMLGPHYRHKVGLEAYDVGTRGEDLSWLGKIPEDQPVYAITSSEEQTLGFEHLIDELRNATSANSDLPANLRWKPEDLKKVTMEQAVERVAKINDWRAAQMAAAQKAAREGIPLHKEYEGGFQWMAAPDTAIDPKSLQYIKDVGCEGGWCTQGEDAARRYGGGGNQLYVLHEPSGKPVVQISVKPGKPWNERSGVFHNNPELEDSWRQFAIEASSAEKGNRPTNYIVRYPEWLSKNHPDLYQKYAHVFEKDPPEIVEIKGKQNRAPKEEHLPMVQDFVRSGRWSRVGDIQNTGMRAASSVFNDAELQRLRDAGETNIPYILSGEDIQRLHNLITPEGRRLKYDAKGNIVGSEEAGYAKGGLVRDTDAIAAKLTGMDKDKALTHALRMANAKQEAHMAGGGIAKLLKGAKAAGEAAKTAEKAVEVAKPAVKGPQAEALETARKNAVKMLGLPPQNTPQERAKAMGYVPDVSGNLYRGSHQAPVSSRGDVAAPAYALDQVYPDDVYSSKAARYYGHGSDPSEDADVVRRLQRVRSHPDEPLVVFRAVPKDAPDHINHGDWVTLSKKYAEEHGEGRFGDDYKVIRDRVPAKTLFTDGNSIYEFGYDKTQKFAEGPASLPVMRSPIPGRRERSSFAAFDPARSSESDILGAADPALLAGTAVASGIGLGALGQMSKPKPKQEEKKKAAGGLAKRM